MSDSASLEIELEHAIGCNGTALHTVVAHSREPKAYFYTFGSLIVIANIEDPYESVFHFTVAPFFMFPRVGIAHSNKNCNPKWNG
jgi:hypothetical protein